MSKSQELKTTHNLVKRALEESTRARNSDNYLYYHVCELIAREKGISIQSITMPTFLLQQKKLGFPCFETVRRARQKIQHMCPHLCGNDDVEAQKLLNQEIFENYAKAVNV